MNNCPVIVIHSVAGNQIAIAKDSIVSVVQKLSSDQAMIYINGDDEPVESQETWEEVMTQWIGAEFRFSNKDRLASIEKVVDTEEDEQD